MTNNTNYFEEYGFDEYEDPQLATDEEIRMAEESAEDNEQWADLENDLI